MSFLSSLKDYAAPLTEKVKEMKENLPGQGGDAAEKGEKVGDKGEKALAARDPEFEATRKDWQKLNSFLGSMLESIVQSTNSLRDISKPNDVLCTTVNLFYQDSKYTSKEATQFGISVAKLKEGTGKFADMMQSYNVKEELESWLAKLAEVKREINQRDTLLLKYTRGEADHKNARVKAEQKGMLRDAATVVKLNKMEAEWTGAKETYMSLNEKVINDVKGMNSRIFPVVNDQIKTIATSQFWLFWTLSEGYSHWHQQEVNKSSIRQRRRYQTRTGDEPITIPDNPAGKAGPQTPPKKLPPSPGGKALPKPPPKKAAEPTSSPATPAPTDPAAPTSAPTVVVISTATAAASNPAEQKILALQKRNIEEEKEDLAKERERLHQEWEEVENEKIRLIRIKKEEMQKVEEAKIKYEEDYKERLRHLENKYKVLEAERKAVAEEKIRLEKRLKLEEERIEKRKQLEDEYKKMDEERKALEAKKIELAEGKMKKRLEDEWRRLDAKRGEIEAERKKEEERRRQEEEARLEDEKKRIEWEAEERRKREEEARLEEEKERERLDRIKRQMEEDRRRLEMTKRRMFEEDDVLSIQVPAFKRGTVRLTPATASGAPAEAKAGESEPKAESAPSVTVSQGQEDKADETVKMLVKALYKYDAAEEGELSFAQGEIMIADYDGDVTGWWMAKKRNGEEGIVPANFVKKYDPETDSVSAADIKSEPTTAAESKPTPTQEPQPEQQSEQKPAEPKPEAQPEAQPEKKPEAQPEKQPEKQAEPPKEAAASAAPAPSPVQVEAPPVRTSYNPVELGRVKALFDYAATEDGELSFKKDDIIILLERDDEGGWWIGELNGEMGLFPKGFVAEITTTTTTTNTAPEKPKEQVPEQPRQPEKEPEPVVVQHPEVKKPFGGVKMFPDPPRQEEAKVEYVKALYDYTAQEDGELSFKEGDAIRVVDRQGDGSEGWWTGMLQGKTGTFPTNFTGEPYFA